MYSDTLIVNVKDATDIVKTISDSENYRTQTEIPGEDLPADVDIVIIIGADQDN